MRMYHFFMEDYRGVCSKVEAPRNKNERAVAIVYTHALGKKVN